MRTDGIPIPAAGRRFDETYFDQGAHQRLTVRLFPWRRWSVTDQAGNDYRAFTRERAILKARRAARERITSSGLVP